MRPAAELIAEGRAAAPTALPVIAFLREHDARSEVEYIRRCRDEGRVMYHMHVGLSTWEATEDALRTVHAALAGEGHRVDRYGLAFDRANAIDLAERLTVVARAAGWNGRIFMGGILNQDTGTGLPVDARPRLAELGVRCVERVDDLARLLAGASG